MEPTHPLKSLLHHQLASDSAAVAHLPYVLSSLNATCFTPSSHLIKWTTRITSLIQAKEAAARWAGICLAHRSAVLSRDILIENASSWLSIALPLLSRDEPVPTLKAALRLLRTIFTSVTDLLEFQRQVAIPNVPKFTATLLSLGEKSNEHELLILVMETLRQIITHYPTLHRPSHPTLSAFTFRFLNGATPHPVSLSIQQSASRLYASLHLTGGKAGSAAAWRKSLDETLALAWTSLLALRTSFPIDGRPDQHSGPIPLEEGLISVPLNYERLKSCIIVVGDLLHTSTHRPVQVPLGALVKLAISMLVCDTDSKIDAWFEPTIRALEVSLVPKIWDLASDLISQLVKCVQQLLAPYIARLVTCITVRLEQNPLLSQQIHLLSALKNLLQSCPNFSSQTIPTRLVKALLPTCKSILSSASTQYLNESSTLSSKKSGKKRARNYEGAEVFIPSKSTGFATHEHCKLFLLTFDVIELLITGPFVAPHVQSLTSRILLGILLTLPQLPPAAISVDPSMHTGILKAVRSICLKLGSGTTNVMSRSLSLVAQASLPESDPDVHNFLELLLHPRVPPLIRSMPYLESLALFPSEESQDETELRHSLGLSIVSEPPSANQTHTQAYPQQAPQPFLTSQPASSGSSELRESISAPVPSVTWPVERTGLVKSASERFDLPPTQPLSQPQRRLPPSLASLTRDDPMNVSHPNLAASSRDSKNNLMDISQSSTDSTRSLKSKEDLMDVSLLSIPMSIEEEEEMPTIDMDSDLE